MDTLVSINREIYPPEEAVISVFDHGFLFGDSIYEVVRTYGGVPFALKEHLGRLMYSASRLCLPLPYPPREIADEVIRGLKLKRYGETKIRIIITRGMGEMSLSIKGCERQNMILIFLPYLPFPDEYYTKGVKTALVNVQSLKTGATPQIKTGNYIVNVLALIEANNQNAFEGIMLNSEGHLAECTTSSIFLVKGDKLVTPNLESGILDGITRKLVVELACESNISVEERPVAREELLEATELFITSTLKELIPVNSIGDYFLPPPVPGPITQTLMCTFAQRIKSFRNAYPNLEIYQQNLHLP